MFIVLRDIIVDEIVLFFNDICYSVLIDMISNCYFTALFSMRILQQTQIPHMLGEIKAAKAAKEPILRQYLPPLLPLQISQSAWIIQTLFTRTV